MKYYQNKKTGEIIGVENMRDVIDKPTEAQTKIGYIGYSYSVVYDMICPNKLLANGLKSFCISYRQLVFNYKRIKKEIALSKYPDFHQYNYDDLQKEAITKNCTTLEIIQKQTF